MIAVGALTLVVGDALWALQASAGTWEPVMDSNALYPLWPALAALAAWLPKPAQRTTLVGSGVRTQRPRSSSPSRRSCCSWPTSGSRFPLPPSPSPA